MIMFCFQCQETAKNTGCTVKGVCGKPEETANLQDLLIFVLKGISVYGEKLKELGAADRSNDDFISQGLFATITNANWDDTRFTAMITGRPIATRSVQIIVSGRLQEEKRH
jgi:hydroxylamine reductase